MKSKNKKVKSFNLNRLTKPVIISIILVVALFGGLKIYSNYNRPDTTPVTEGPTAEQNKQASDINAEDKKSFIDTSGSNGDASVPPSEPPAGIAIDLSAKREPDSTVTIIVKLPGVSSGSCNLKITNGTKNVSKTASVIYQSEFSTCAGFSIPISDLGTGTWNITLSLTDSTKSGSKSIEFGVN